MALIELERISRSYRVGCETLAVLRDVTLRIDEGEFVAIMGPSGSGKSTLMQILGLLDRPSSGRYRLLGRDVSRLTDDQGAALRSRAVGFVFQMFNLLPRTTALDNVALPLIYSGANGRLARAKELLELVGLGDRTGHWPSQLSGGQQQRVAIARALVNSPRLIFADEPTGNLASDQAGEILALLEGLNRRDGMTVIMVTHEPEIAARAGRVVRIKDGAVVSDETGASASARGGAPAAAPAESRPLTARAVVEYCASAGRAMAANKLRTALSMLGILIGVAAVIAMLAIGRGAQQAIEARLKSLGSNMVMIFNGSPSSRGIHGPTGAYARLTLADARAIRRLPGVVDLYPEAEANVSVVSGDKNAVTEMQGVTPNYESIRSATPRWGRFFTPAEDASMARVVVLGQTVVNELFGSEDPVGRIVKINRQSFRVIGILPLRGSSAFSDQDDMIIVPINTAMKRVIGTVYLHEMAMECESPETVDLVMQGVERLMRRRRRLPDYKEDDFTIRNMAALQETLSATTRTVSLLLAIVAAISLVVGGVGIMNIMLVSVNERTREIGLRKAVGAARSAVLTQFLVESLALSAFGGLLGVLAGVSVSLGLSALAGWAAVVTPQSIALAFVFSAAVGVVFGLWPARKASLLSPIEALRYE